MKIIVYFMYNCISYDMQKIYNNFIILLELMKLYLGMNMQIVMLVRGKGSRIVALIIQQTLVLFNLF